MSSARKMKLRLQAPKPRNPLVPAAAQRKAGSHRKSEAGRRRADKIALQRELKKI